MSELILGPQLPVGTTWFDQVELSRGEFHAAQFLSTTDPDVYVNTNYYDLGLTLRIAYTRSGDSRYLDLSRKVADSWWLSPQIDSGKQRGFGEGLSYSPRNSSLGGLMLRAGERPEIWDWINAYTRAQFDIWVKRWVDSPVLVNGVRDAAFMFQYATWLSVELPDRFPLLNGGETTNGKELREQYRADVESIALNYFGRLQQGDGSWRWDDGDVTDPDGGTLKGITQPFHVGLLMSALVDLHRVTTSNQVKESIKSQLTRSCLHLFNDGPYRRTPSGTGVNWRSFWYLYHGGTSVNPAKFEQGGWSPVTTTQQWEVKSERQLTATIFPAYGYLYAITGDGQFRAMGDELFGAAFGDSEDTVRNELDGTAKNYNQNCRRGGSYLIWRSGVITPQPQPPTPQPTPQPLPTPCTISAPPAITVPRNGSGEISITLSNLTEPTTITVIGSDGQVTVSPLSKVASPTGAILAFKVRVKKQSRVITFQSPCGSVQVRVNVS